MKIVSLTRSQRAGVAEVERCVQRVGYKKRMPEGPPHVDRRFRVKAYLLGISYLAHNTQKHRDCEQK
jgi:hypothetical protein